MNTTTDDPQPYGTLPGEAPDYLVDIPQSKWQTLYSTQDWWSYWKLKPTKRGPVTKDYAAYKISVACYLRHFNDKEVKTVLHIWHGKHKFAFDVAEWESKVRPNAVKKAAGYGPDSKRTSQIEEGDGNVSRLICRDSRTGKTVPVLFDRFQEFRGNPSEFEWILDERGMCVAKENGVSFATMFLHFSNGSVLYLENGNHQDLRGDNVTRRKTETKLGEVVARPLG